MKSIRLSFLPAFFICLAIVFSTVVAFRIRSYRTASNAGPSPVSQQTATPSEPPGPRVETPAPELPIASPTAPDPGPPAREHSTDSESVPPPMNSAVPRDEVNRLFEAVWFNPTTMRTGETNALHLRAAGTANITSFSGALQNAARTARLPFRCSHATGSEWSCAIVVPSCVACGRWSIGHLEIANGGDVLTVPGSHPLLSGAGINLSGERCDAAPPVLHAVTVGQTDPGDDEENILFTFTAADAYCGIGSVSGIAESARGQRVPFTATLAGDDNTWAGRLTVSSSTERGKWRLSSVEVVDQAGNFRIYSAADPALKDAVFEVR